MQLNYISPNLTYYPAVMMITGIPLCPRKQC